MVFSLTVIGLLRILILICSLYNVRLLRTAKLDEAFVGFSFHIKRFPGINKYNLPSSHTLLSLVLLYQGLILFCLTIFSSFSTIFLVKIGIALLFVALVLGWSHDKVAEMK